jgi:hypothetical protein
VHRSHGRLRAWRLFQKSDHLRQEPMLHRHYQFPLIQLKLIRLTVTVVTYNHNLIANVSWDRCESVPDRRHLGVHYI